MVPTGVIRRHRAAGFKPQVYRVVELAQEIVPSTEDKLASGSASGTALRSVAHSASELGTVAGADWAPTRRGPQDSVNGKAPRLALSWKQVPFLPWIWRGLSWAMVHPLVFGRRSTVRAGAELGRVTWQIQDGPLTRLPGGRQR